VLENRDNNLESALEYFNDNPAVSSIGGTSSFEGEMFQKTVVLRVTQELCRRQTKACKDTYDADFLHKLIMGPLVKRRTYLLEKAALANKAEGETWLKDLKEAFLKKIKSNLLKASMVDIAVLVWGVLSLVISNNAGTLSSKVENEMGSYITLMEHTFSNCKAVLRDEMTVADKMKVVKMPAGEENCGYCDGGATKPPSHLWIYPRCENQFMHEPPTNKDIHARNKEKQKDWDHLNIALSDYNKGHHSHPPVDAKGKVLSKIPSLKLEDEILVCKVYTLQHSLAIDGYKCPHCVTRSCATCKNKCRHVCTKR
jgi:hypothetical protein